MKDVILYHGSRGGIEGDIAPISRDRCDFGKGFYLGSSPEQAKSLIIDDPDPVFYTVKLNLSQIPENKILVLNDKDWLYTVLAFRNRVKEFCKLQVAKDLIDKANSYDVIIGQIADDRLSEAMREFSRYALSDKALFECISKVDLGTQYVLKTETACKCVEVISEREIYGEEADDIRIFTQNMRSSVKDIVNEMRIKYLRDGKYLNEIIDEIKLRQKNEMIAPKVIEAMHTRNNKVDNPLTLSNKPGNKPKM